MSGQIDCEFVDREDDLGEVEPPDERSFLLELLPGTPQHTCGNVPCDGPVGYELELIIFEM